MPEAAKLNRLIRNISRFQLAHQARTNEIDIDDFPENKKVYSHFMSIILVSGASLKITFKTHFKSKDAKVLASSIFNVKPDDVSVPQSLDFFREFCNLTAGSIKWALSQHEVEVGISLPIVTRGFDEIFFPRKQNATHFHDAWKLKASEMIIVCTSNIEFTEAVNLSKLDENFDGSSGGQGEVEFL
jgi:CheY-specific phosphatase CheX